MKEKILNVIKTLVTTNLKTTLIVAGASVAIIGATAGVIYVQSNKPTEVVVSEETDVAGTEETITVETEKSVADTEDVETEPVAKTETQYATTDVNIRSAKDTSSDKLGQLKAGESIQIVRTDGEWTEVIYNDSTAYILNKYLSTEKPIVVASTDKETDTTADKKDGNTAQPPKSSTPASSQPASNTPVVTEQHNVDTSQMDELIRKWRDADYKYSSALYTVQNLEQEVAARTEVLEYNTAAGWSGPELEQNRQDLENAKQKLEAAKAALPAIKAEYDAAYAAAGVTGDKRP